MAFKRGDLVEYQDPRADGPPHPRDFGVVVETSKDPVNSDISVFFLSDRETCWGESTFLAMVDVPARSEK